MKFRTVADCRDFVHAYCANPLHAWKGCTIAQARTDAIERQERIKKEVREWKDKRKGK